MKTQRIATIAAVLGLAMGSLAGAAQAAAASKADKAAAYQTLLQSAQKGDAAVDWQALRFAYSDVAGFGGDGDSLRERRKAMFAAISRKDDAGVLKEAQAILKINYADPEAHLLTAAAYAHQGKNAESARERDIGLAIFKSIMTGDGKSAATAFTAVTIGEEYELMQYLHQQVDQQSLVHKDGHGYDVLQTTGADGGKSTYWFQIDRILAAETAALFPDGPPN